MKLTEAEVCEIPIVDERFKLINTFALTVPRGYDHSTRLDKFRREYSDEFYSYSNALTNNNFAGATTRLVSGRKYNVKIFQIATKRMPSEDCMSFLWSQKAILVGAQGASLVWEYALDKLPISRWSISFDEKEALWKDAGYHRVPIVYRHWDDDFMLHLGYFESDWNYDHCLLCFCDAI